MSLESRARFLRGWRLWFFIVLSPFLFVDGLDAAIGGGHARVGPNRWVHEMFGDTSPPTTRGIRSRHGRTRFEISMGLPTHLFGVAEVLFALAIWAGAVFAWRPRRAWEVVAMSLIAAGLCTLFPAVIASFAV